MSQYERIANFEVVLELRDIRRRRIRKISVLSATLLCATILGCIQAS